MHTHAPAYTVTDIHHRYVYTHRHVLHRHMDPIVKHRFPLRCIYQSYLHHSCTHMHTYRQTHLEIHITLTIDTHAVFAYIYIT